MKITKDILTQELCVQYPELTHRQAKRSLEALLRIAKENLVNGSDLLLSRFGKFVLRDKTARLGRNVHTGEELQISPRRVVTFRASRLLVDKLND